MCNCEGSFHITSDTLDAWAICDVCGNVTPPNQVPPDASWSDQEASE